MNIAGTCGLRESYKEPTLWGSSMIVLVAASKIQLLFFADLLFILHLAFLPTADQDTSRVKGLSILGCYVRAPASGTLYWLSNHRGEPLRLLSLKGHRSIQVRLIKSRRQAGDSKKRLTGFRSTRCPFAGELWVSPQCPPELEREGWHCEVGESLVPSVIDVGFLLRSFRVSTFPHIICHCSPWFLFDLAGPAAGCALIRLLIRLCWTQLKPLPPPNRSQMQHER